MSTEVKIVARTKRGETLKGFADPGDLDNMNTGGSIYLHLAKPGNTTGVYISQDQLEGLFLVESFAGRKPALHRRLYNDLRRMVRDNLPVISAASIVAMLSLVGLTALL